MNRTTHVAQIAAYGGPERIEWTERPLAPPGPGEILVRHRAAGLNFIDVYQRTGLYPLPLPAVLGIEAVGIVEEVGAGASLRVGERVAYAGAPGAYAERRVLPAWRAIRVPDDVPDEVAAVALARGITVHMLEERVFAVTQGTRVLVHSAAGGLGGMLAREAKRRGAFVIGTVGAASKVAAAKAAGADAVIVGRDADFGREVRSLTEGALVDVAYDGVGGTTLAKTLDCVRPFGMVVSFGQAAGPIPKLAVEELGPRRSLALARPSVMAYMADADLYRVAADAVFARGSFPTIGQTYRLAEAAAAHRALESGATVGASVLVVDAA